jgi:hypothetical protein
VQGSCPLRLALRAVLLLQVVQALRAARLLRAAPALQVVVRQVAPGLQPALVEGL